jgi:TatD DNase family protein
LPAICTALAAIMSLAPEQLATASTANARELFNW